MYMTRVFDAYSFSFILWINNFFFLRIIIENEEVPFFFPSLRNIVEQKF